MRPSQLRLAKGCARDAEERVEELERRNEELEDRNRALDHLVLILEALAAGLRAELKVATVRTKPSTTGVFT